MISDLKKSPLLMSKLYIGNNNDAEDHNEVDDPMEEILEEGFSHRNGAASAIAAAAALKQQELDDNAKCPFSENREHEPSVILKDNDIKHKFRISPETAGSFMRQLRKDVIFLASLGIMDYSLLLGVHNTEYVVKLDIGAATQSKTTSFSSPSTTSSVDILAIAFARKLTADLSSTAEVNNDNVSLFCLLVM